MFRGRLGQERMSANRVENPVDGNRCGDSADKIADGYDELRLGNSLQTGHVILGGIFHGVHQSGGGHCRHFRGQQESAGLHQQETGNIVQRVGNG